MSGLSPAASAALGLAVVLGLMTAVWVGSLMRRDASLVDRFWGAGFVVVAAVYYLTRPASADGSVPAVLMGLVAVWGLRLSAHLTARNWGHGEDYRYREMRARGGSGFPVRSLVTIHWLQGLILWFVAMPLFAGMRTTTPAGPVFWLGVVVWAVGFWFESVGDRQLAAFRRDPGNRGRVLDTGVWRYSRHPNYFGDAAVWWGFYLMAAGGGGWWTLLSPVVMTAMLLKVSGVVLLEKKLASTKPDYRAYVERTSAFVPWPPRSG